ncbi:MarR family transcriptional regulator [Yinghuangia soli]|uniref:Winged helix-turn-helix domain-containing protein n=1 Tax=Yinghuangia soli TaxID=2908204 RepID=A0AA41U4Y0_9ACTN|nr:helix-turn-helix domain-containing protein [Yinghuangia soli]MCF2533415.1 winged helix-turn-helix domain-containing protein [Yinghuangia soli]
MDENGPRLRSSWTFLTQHARVLGAVAAEPEIRVREIAARCEVTERAVQSILLDLEQAGYITRTRNGRRTVYYVVPGTRLRHRGEAGKPVEDLLALLYTKAAEPGPDDEMPAGWGRTPAQQDDPDRRD